jgi:hypothetical protein
MGRCRQRGKLTERRHTVGSCRVREVEQLLGLTDRGDADAGDLLGGP